MKSFLKLFMLAFLLLLPLEYSSAFEDIKTLFVKGNEAYKANDMEDAQKYYQQIIDQGFCNGYVFFNLGNTYLRQGKIGEAVLNYELAKKWIPRYPELQENYRVARSKNEFKEKKIPIFFEFVFYWHLNTSINEELSLSLIAFLAALLVLYLKGSPKISMNKSLLAPISVVLLLFWLLTLGGSAYRIKQEYTQKIGVLTATKVKVYFGPSSTQEKIQSVINSKKSDLLLPAGLLFKIETITETEGEMWWQVRFENGVRGWIPAKKAAAIKLPAKKTSED